MNIIQQVKFSARKANRLAALFGFLFGAFVPIAIYWLSHHECIAGQWVSAPNTLVLGGLCYSAQTVYKWARMAFDNAVKSLGFCVLLEGVMVTSKTHWLAVAALLYLVVINAIATSCTVALSGKAKRI